MVNCVKGSRQIQQDEYRGLEAALASLRASVTESRAVSVEWPLLKPDWLLSRMLFCARNRESWLNTTRSSDFAMNGRRDTGL